MIKNKEKILILMLSTLSLIAAQQNLCEQAKPNSFAADPSDCTRYIHCERDSDGELVRIGYGQCDQSTAFKYFKNNACTTDNSLCAPLALCTGSPDYRVASPSDSCTLNRYCKLEAMPPTDCTDAFGDYGAFDRNTGQCIDNINGFIGNCPSQDNPVTTPKPNPCESASANYIYVQDGSCSEWAFCVNYDIYDRGVCPCGQTFGTTANPCIPDTAGTCNPCATTQGSTTTIDGTTTTESTSTVTTTESTSTVTTTVAPDVCIGKTDGFFNDAAQSCDEWVECTSEVTTDSGICDCGEEFDSAAIPPCKPWTNPTFHCSTGVAC